jgi:hypothetical protein
MIIKVLVPFRPIFGSKNLGLLQRWKLLRADAHFRKDVLVDF